MTLEPHETAPDKAAFWLAQTGFVDTSWETRRKKDQTDRRVNYVVWRRLERGASSPRTKSSFCFYLHKLKRDQHSIRSQRNLWSGVVAFLLRARLELSTFFGRKASKKMTPFARAIGHFSRRKIRWRKLSNHANEKYIFIWYSSAD